MVFKSVICDNCIRENPTELNHVLYKLYRQGELNRRAPRGQEGQEAPNVPTVIQREWFLGGKQLPRAFPYAVSLPIAWNSDSSSSSTGEGKKRQSSRRMRKTVRTVSCVDLLSRVRHPLSLGTEPWGNERAGQDLRGTSLVPDRWLEHQSVVGWNQIGTWKVPGQFGTSLVYLTPWKKRKRVDAPAPVLALVKAMRESDTKYMDFMQVQVQAERDFRERQMALDREQREQEREASTTLNTQLISVLGRIGEALLTRNAKDIPVD
ncbi:UNVERIFIED_CONTAM: hypothetical protein FKN15_029618 [Acipenser sinensis]